MASLSIKTNKKPAVREGTPETIAKAILDKEITEVTLFVGPNSSIRITKIRKKGKPDSLEASLIAEGTIVIE